MSTVLFWALLAEVVVAAPNGPLVLDWSGPSECPDSATIQREVLQLAQVTTVPLHHVTAVARVQRRGHAYHLSLSAELDGVSGERQFDGQSCDSVAEAAVLTLALMLNPDAQVERRESPAPSERARPAAAGPLSREPPPPVSASSDRAPANGAPSASPSWPLYVVGGVMGGFRTGVLPKVGPELGLDGGVLVGPLSLTLAASAMPPQSAPAPGSPDARAELWLLSLGVLLGWHTRFERFGFGLRSGVDWTLASGKGDGISDPEQGRIHWLSVQFGGTGSFALTQHVELGSGVFGLIPLARPGFTFQDLGTIYRPQQFGIRAYLAVILKTP